MATEETKAQKPKTDLQAKKPLAGLNAAGLPFPGVDPDTGERHAVTWNGLREEFGTRTGSKLYNDIAVAAFGGVQPSRPALSILTLQDKYMRTRGKHESEEEFAKVKEKFQARRVKVEKLLSEAVKGE
jgi:hypothetical protein